MSSGGDAAAVSLNGAVGVTNSRSTGAAQAPGFDKRTAIDLSGTVNELTVGTVCAADAATGAETGPYRKSRLRMQEAARRYTEELRRTQGVKEQIRVGLNSGNVVVRSIGSGLRINYTAVAGVTKPKLVHCDDEHRAVSFGRR